MRALRVLVTYVTLFVVLMSTGLAAMLLFINVGGATPPVFYPVIHYITIASVLICGAFTSTSLILKDHDVQTPT